MAPPSSRMQAGAAFRSAQDSWLMPVLTVPPAVAFMALLYVQHWVTPFSGLLVAGVVVLPMLLAYSAAWMLTEYQFGGDSLIVRCGPLRWRIAYRDIDALDPVWSLRPAPALSVRRLRLGFRGQDQLMISPLQRDLFVDLLQARCPQLRRDADQLRRSGGA